MIKTVNLNRLEAIERRIGERSLEHEAAAYQTLLERWESGIRQFAEMSGEDPEAAVEDHRVKQGGAIKEQVEEYIEELRQGGPTIREQGEVYIEERQEQRKIEARHGNCFC
jgi:hypothetical protein